MDKDSTGTGSFREHRLAAIMFTDIEGYTSLMQHDESQAIAIRQRHREVFRNYMEQHHGTILQYYGDGTLSTFESAIDAVRCAIDMQNSYAVGLSVPVRIGIHSGDIIVSDEDVIGDGVNVASRIESLAVAGSILVSEKVYDEIKNQSDIRTTTMGLFELKNIDKPVEVYAIANDGLVVPRPDVLVGKGVLINQPPKARISRSLKWVLVAAAVVIAGLLIYNIDAIRDEINNNSLPGELTMSRASVAVLPFRTIGGDEESQYFAEGVREEILNHLTRIEGLRVKSRTVVDRLDQQNLSTEDIVSKLNITHYLEGSARREGSRIRITVQFIDAQNNEHLWAENYDRDYDNIWQTQSEIATRVAEIMRVKVEPQTVRMLAAKPTNNPEAWDDYLRAAYYLRRYIYWRSAEDQRFHEAGDKMVDYIKSSIRKDSTFALGYSFLAYVYRDILPDSSRILNDRAIELNPDLSTPYYVRGEYRAYIEKDDRAAIRDFELSIANGPELSLPYWHYAMFRRSRGETAQALKLTFQALDRQPEIWLAAQMLVAIGMDYTDIGDYEKATYYIDKALVLEPDNLTFHMRKAHVLRVTGDFDKLYEVIRTIEVLSPGERGPFEWGLYYLMQHDYERSVSQFEKYFTSETKPGVFSDGHMYSYALIRTGRSDEAQRWLGIMRGGIEGWDHPTGDYELAKICAATGELDSAYIYLEQAVDEKYLRYGLADFMTRDPVFEDLVGQPRFVRLAEQAKARVAAERQKVRAYEMSGEIPGDLAGFGIL